MTENKSLVMFQQVEGQKNFTASVPGLPFTATGTNPFQAIYLIALQYLS